MSKLKLFILLFFLLTLPSCTTVYNPATQQNEMYFITTPMEVSLGNSIATEIESKSKIIKEGEEVDKVKKIGEKITVVSDRKDLKYTFKIIEDKEINAFTIPGGHVYVTTGLLEKASEDELACVLGHEVGHVAARHIAKKLQTQIGYDILMNIASRTANIKDIQRVTSLTYNLVMLGYSRKDELLADELAVKYAYKAGYDPYAMLTFLEKLKKLNEEIPILIFLRSHPYPSDRIKNLKTNIPKITEKADKKTVPDTHIEPLKKEQKAVTPNPPMKKRTNATRKMCPTCKKVFPGNFNYCPKDGIELE